MPITLPAACSKPTTSFSWVIILTVVGTSLLGSGCNDSSHVQHINFRVNTAFSASPNTSPAQPSPLNENVTVYADQPFSIQLELDSPTNDTLRLEYKRDEGEWTLVEKAAFPYPESASPRVSIVSGDAFAVKQSEITWPLVIRRFADGAVTNNEGDVFSFRLITSSGTPIESSAVPSLPLSIEVGHLGGTFVETPGRIGPWQTQNGDLYFIMEPSETDNVLMMVKSEDGGRTWFEVDGANRPTADDLEGVASVYADGGIHILHQTSDNVWHHAFNTSDHSSSPDTWAVTDEEAAAPGEPPTQVAAMAARSDGSLVGVYGGPEKIHVKTRTAEDAWTREMAVDADDEVVYSGPQVVTGQDNVVHLAYTGSDGSAWYRTIQPDGTLTERQQITQGIGTTEYDVGSILPLVFVPESNSVVILYRLESGLLWERRATRRSTLSNPVQVSDIPVVQNAVDSDQVGADAIAFNEQVHLLFIEQDSGTIFYTYSDKTGSWHPPTIQVDNIQAQWIRGARHTQPDGSFSYAYIYDAGSDGGSGMNKFARVNLK